MTDSIKATRPKGRLRSPKVKDEIRFCAQEDCTTQLSRYNARKHCYAHAPLRFPRVRGREILERPTQSLSNGYRFLNDRLGVGRGRLRLRRA